MVPSELINFGMEPVTPSIIMVAGVGGGGSNAVNHMFELGIAQVTFMICNTDRQALSQSPVPIKVRLGEHLTEGLGAGNNPERGRAAAMESIDDIVAIFKREGTRMVFITAGMGGGTGTGAAPVIAKAARDNGILTVGIVTLPFKAEGKVRALNAMEGIEQLRGNVDALLVINNENIQEIYGKLPLTEAFGKADDILATGARGIAEIITREGLVNVDFADVSTVMRSSGIALMGSARASGEDRAEKVAQLALSSPLLNHNSIVGAQDILLSISWGDEEITLDEMHGIVNYIQEQTRTGNDTNIIWGAGRELSLGKDIEVTIVATGFDIDEDALWRSGRAGGRAGQPEPQPGLGQAGTGFAGAGSQWTPPGTAGNGQAAGPQWPSGAAAGASPAVGGFASGDDEGPESAGEGNTAPEPCGEKPRRTRFQPPNGQQDPHAFWAQSGTPGTVHQKTDSPLDPTPRTIASSGTVIE
ncbi:MAG: cell division protein FtsZ, partial [Rikenellaceae bacterium]|nr:cell division protein FtsZ [Rikenellaceae bacterium]